MSSTPDDNIFIVPFEVFQALTEIEQVVIRAQASQGKVRIVEPPQGMSDGE
jgi:hypothetical protein